MIGKVKHKTGDLKKTERRYERETSSNIQRKRKERELIPKEITVK